MDALKMILGTIGGILLGRFVLAPLAMMLFELVKFIKRKF